MSEFLDALRAWTPERTEAHPRLYFGKDDLPALREKVKRCVNIWNPILERCMGHLKTALTDLSDFKTGRAKAFKLLEEMAFAYVITGETKFADRTKQVVNIILKWDDWVMAEHKPLRVDLATSGIARRLATAYDWLYDLLKPEERAAIRAAIFERGVGPFLEVSKARSEWWTQATHNWRSVICGEMGIAALCFMEDYEDLVPCLEQSMEGVLEVLDRGDADGGWDEGVGYWAYGIGEAVRFADVMARCSGGEVDLFGHEYLGMTADFGLYCGTPDGGCYNFADCRSQRPSPAIMARMASYYQSSTWQWAVNQGLPDDIYGFIWYNPDLEGQLPDDMPPGKLFTGIGVTASRSGWADDKQVFFGLKSGRTDANHSHLDINSFMLSARGRQLAAELGIWPYDHAHGFFDTQGPRWEYDANNTVGHNTLLVNGQGQGYSPEHYGEVIHFETTPKYDTVASDGTRAYGGRLERFIRYAAFVRPDYVVICDDTASAGHDRLSWLLHYEGSIEETWDNVWTVKNEDVFMDILFLRPDRSKGWVLNFSEATTNYKATYTEGSYVNRYVSLSPLHGTGNDRFVVALRPYPVEEPGEELTAEVVEESDEAVTVLVTLGRRKDRITFHLKDRTINVGLGG